MAALTALQRLMASPKTAKFVETLRHADLPVNWADDPEIVKLASDVYKEQGTNSPFFRAWFGSSKVADNAGQPLEVYHGTKARNLQEFSKDKIGKGASKGNNLYGDGFYFTPDYYSAQNFGKNVHDVYLKIENPSISGNLKPGNDGIDVNAGFHRTLVAFDPTQIKSVHNRGTFNPADPNIYRGLIPMLAGGGALAAMAPGSAQAAEATPAETAPQIGGMLGYAARGNPAQAALVAAAQNQDWGEPVTWDDVRHGLSFGSRAVLEGLGGIAEMGPNAIANAAISPFTDYRFGNPGVAAADAMNLDRPQTDAERSMYGLESGAAEAVPFVAGGGALAKGSARAAKQFGKFLADNPRAQAILGGMLGMMMGGGE